MCVCVEWRLEPGFMNTGILDVDKHIESLWNDLDPEIKTQYGQDHVASLKDLLRKIKQNAGDPSLVTEVVTDALFRTHPKKRFDLI